MDRTLLLDYAVAIPVGHRVEVSEVGAAVALADLDTGIRYLPSERATGDAPARTWHGRVLACVVAPGARHPHTTLVVTEDEGRPAAAEARVALDGADAALSAANAEAMRWSSTPGDPVRPQP